MRVLLDTQALLLAAGLGDGILSAKVLHVLENPDTERLVSAASLMEIAYKAKLGMKRDDCEQAVVDLALTVIPFAAMHAYRLFSLPFHHRDPFDRMLIATALAEDVPLIGGAREFRRYRGLRVIW